MELELKKNPKGHHATYMYILIYSRQSFSTPGPENVIRRRALYGLSQPP